MKVLPALLLCALWLLQLGCDTIKKIEAVIPPVQLCVTYKGKTFCASKVDGSWRFETELTPEERFEVISHIEGH